MHPNFSGINVYWDANRADAAEIETLLDGLSGKLRYGLLRFGVMINFKVKAAFKPC